MLTPKEVLILTSADDFQSAVIHAAARICGVIAVGETLSVSQFQAAEFHFVGLFQEQLRWTQSRLAFALACRIAPEYRITLPWRIRISRGRWT